MLLASVSGRKVLQMKERKKQFGTRFLTDESEVFKFNAWDDVEWGFEQEEEARNRIANQKKSPAVSQEIEYLLQNPAEQWDTFYRIHKGKFFMDRNWLLSEFQELNVECRVSYVSYYVIYLKFN